MLIVVAAGDGGCVNSASIDGSMSRCSDIDGIPRDPQPFANQRTHGAGVLQIPLTRTEQNQGSLCGFSCAKTNKIFFSSFAFDNRLCKSINSIFVDRRWRSIHFYHADEFLSLSFTRKKLQTSAAALTKLKTEKISHTKIAKALATRTTVKRHKRRSIDPH